MNASTIQPSAGLAQALEHAIQLLDRDPALAREQAEAILEAMPRHAATTVVLASAHRLGGDPNQALAVVAPLARALPTMVSAQIELGLTLADLGRTTEAVAAFQRAVVQEPRAVEAWRAWPRASTCWATRRAPRRPWPSSCAPRPVIRP
jgi:Flp pilus assembly protein TadD